MSASTRLVPPIVQRVVIASVLGPKLSPKKFRSKKMWLRKSPSPFGRVESWTAANVARSTWAFQMFSAWVTAAFQLLVPSGNVPEPLPSARCMVMLPLSHFEPSVEKPRVGSEADRDEGQGDDQAERRRAGYGSSAAAKTSASAKASADRSVP